MIGSCCQETFIRCRETPLRGDTYKEITTMKKLTDLHSLFIHELKDLYNAEHQLTKALPKMAKAANSDDLRTAFEEHLQETERQVERLDKVFEKLGTKPTGVKCAAMIGLIEEGKEYMEQDSQPEVLDAALICAASAWNTTRSPAMVVPAPWPSNSA